MEEIYHHYDMKATPRLNIKDYFQRYSQMFSNYTTKDIAQVMEVEIDKDEMQELENSCNVDEIFAEESSMTEFSKNEVHKTIKKTAQFEVNDELATLKGCQNIHTTEQKKLQNELLVEYEECNSVGIKAIPRQDIIVYVDIFRPFLQQSRYSNDHKINKMNYHCTIEILGQQNLAQLKDKIPCLSDLSITYDISNNPDKKIDTLARDVYKSGFFYIDGTFYNDMRHSDNIDYSASIFAWAQTANINSFNTALMENCTVDSLITKFHYPWVYQHQGSCEHIITFANARLLNYKDELSIEAYPRIIKIANSATKYCTMCTKMAVQWIVTNSDRIPHNPCYYCDGCFKSYHYINGKKLGDFQAYRYPHNPKLVEGISAL